jgi:hypothetical protein
MDRLTVARIQTVRDHIRLECESDWDGVIATFASTAWNEIRSARRLVGAARSSCRPTICMSKQFLPQKRRLSGENVD